MLGDRVWPDVPLHREWVDPGLRRGDQLLQRGRPEAVERRSALVQHARTGANASQPSCVTRSRSPNHGHRKARGAQRSRDPSRLIESDDGGASQRPGPTPRGRRFLPRPPSPLRPIYGDAYEGEPKNRQLPWRELARSVAALFHISSRRARTRPILRIRAFRCRGDAASKGCERFIRIL